MVVIRREAVRNNRADRPGRKAEYSRVCDDRLFEGGPGLDSDFRGGREECKGPGRIIIGVWFCP